MADVVSIPVPPLWLVLAALALPLIWAALGLWMAGDAEPWRENV